MLESTKQTSNEAENGNKSKPLLQAVRVQWHVEALIECPHCEIDNDFTEVDEFYNYTQPMENVVKFFSPVQFECKHCGEEFTVDGSDY
jgi:hypothetical protein